MNSPPPPPSAWRERAKRWPWGMIGAGAGGAAAMLAIILALWGMGAFSQRDDIVNALVARLAILELQLRDVSSRQPPPGADPRVVAELASRLGAAEQSLRRLSEVEQRLAKAETALSNPASDPALRERIGAAETTLRALVDGLSELRKRNEEAAALLREAKTLADKALTEAQKAAGLQPKDLEALRARLAAVEAGEKRIEERTRTVGTGLDQPARRAFAAVALRGAVERGEPFAAELAMAKQLGDAGKLAALEAFAATGLPKAGELARELSRLTPMLSETPRDASLVEKLKHNAEKLVRIRPLNEAPGDDHGAMLSRAEALASKGDIGGALAELNKLPAPVRQKAEAWIVKAEQREAALRAARTFAADATAALRE